MAHEKCFFIEKTTTTKIYRRTILFFFVNSLHLLIRCDLFVFIVVWFSFYFCFLFSFAQFNSMRPINPYRLSTEIKSKSTKKHELNHRAQTVKLHTKRKQHHTKANAGKCRDDKQHKKVLFWEWELDRMLNFARQNEDR